MFAIETAGPRAVWLVRLDSHLAMELPNPNRQSAV